MFKRRKKRSGKADENPLASRVVRGDDRPTEPLRDDSTAAGKAAPALRRPPDTTRSLGVPQPGHRSETQEPATRLVAAPGAVDDAGECTDELPVAVLLVLRGPGRGSLLPVGAGMNDLGRGSGARIRMDFGDTQIARDRHAVLTFGTESRRFFLQHGGGTDPSYVDGQAVLEPVELRDGARLRFGGTEILFRSLVGPHGDGSEST